MSSLNKRSLAVIDALLPKGEHPHLPGAMSAGFEEAYRDFERTANLPMRAGFKAALAAAIWVAPVMIGAIPPFTRLSKENRERALRAMAKSDFYHVRQMLFLLKAVTSFCYGVHPEVRHTVGFPSPALGFPKEEPEA